MNSAHQGEKQRKWAGWQADQNESGFEQLQKSSFSAKQEQKNGMVQKRQTASETT